MFIDANTNPEDDGAPGVGAEDNGEEEGGVVEMREDAAGPWWTMVLAKLRASIVELLGDRRRGDNSLGDGARLCRCLRATGEADEMGDGDNDGVSKIEEADEGEEERGAGRDGS